VAENTRNIVENSDGVVTFEIFADKEAQIVDPSMENGVTRAWLNRWNPELGELDGVLGLADPDVVHIQFNFGFYELDSLAGLMTRQLEQRAVVMTLHRTRDIEIDGDLVSLRSIRSTLERVDRLIVHQESDAQLLADIGLSANVSVVPMGTEPPPEISPEQAREMLGLGTRPVIGTFGFLLPHKGTLELIGVVDALRAEFPDICLLALCAHYPDVTSGSYEDQVRAEIEARGLKDNVMLITEYLSDETSRTMLRGVDAIALPYRDTGESSSAALRFLLPLERPIVVTDQPIFADCRDWVLAVDPADPTLMQDALRRVLTDVTFQRELASRAQAGARKFRWSRIISDHREIYCASRRVHRPGSLKRP
jgi:glycosyltransferase involved in cell wall biosynthesis